jgi:hypothetical protein
MTAAPRIGMNLLRVALAVALSLSWLIMTGPPASAFVANSYVERPDAAATLAKARDLVVVVERSAPPAEPGEEKIAVDTDLYYAGNTAPPAPEPTEPPSGEGEVSGQAQQPEGPEPVRVNPKPYRLSFRNVKDGERPASQVLRFGETIDPYALAWADGLVAPNGRYILRYWTISRWNGDRQQQEWQPFEFRLSAPPPAQEEPLLAVADAQAKTTRVAWRHNAAPDIASYTIERQLADGEWRVAKSNVKPSKDGANAMTDTVPRYGTYRYRITALRPAGDGSGQLLGTTSPASAPLEVTASDTSQPGDPAGGDDTGGDDGTGDGGDGDGDGTGSSPSFPSNSGGTSTSPGFGTDTEPFNPSVAAPEDFDDTYRGPLDFGVEPQSVTERVPVDIAKGGSSSDSTLEVLDRAIDQERVLPPVAGGLILVISAAHVLRYLNE